MLTENEARSLLATAATTIEVDPPMPLPEQPRRRHPLALVTAAVAVLLAIGGIALARRHHDPAPATPPYDVYAGDASFHLGPDQVPPVTGYPSARARQLLEQRGYVVSERSVPHCPPDGTVTASSPEPGTIAAPGQSVQIEVATFTGLPCPHGLPDTDPFLAWAQGDGPAPRFARRVWVENDDTRVATLTGAARTTVAAWPGLRGLVDAAAGVSVETPGAGTPSYRIVPNDVVLAHAICHGPSGICATYGTRVIEVHGAHTLLAQTTVVVDDHGAIRGVDFIDDRSTAGTFPDVVGDSAAYATARLQAFGFTVTEVPRVDCAPVGVVTKVALEGHDVLIGVTRETGACNRTTP